MRSLVASLSLVLTIVLVLGLGLAPAHAKRPNIVLFYIDDLGYTDLACQGSGYYETPHIDELAAESVVFTDAYANAPNCAPSRACLMSGLYTPRHGVYTVGNSDRGKAKDRKLIPIANKTVLADSFTTIAETLGGAGYKTATMGKWHLGDDPTTQGFDVNIAGKHWGSPSGGGYHSPYKYPNCVQNEKGEYLTDRLTDEAIKFVTRHADQQFFLYLTHYAVHTPIQAKKNIAAKYQSKKPAGGHKNPNYAAMIESMDQSIGRVRATLDKLKLADNTVVLFTSDNGGHGGVTSNAPLRGSKGMLYEGGIRVPLLVKWPGVTKAGARCREPVIGLDLFPTFCEIAGAKAPRQLDGLSLVPLLKDSAATLDRPALFWHFPAYLQGYTKQHGPFRTTPAGAIRVGDWKLVEFFENGALELYNLRDDLSESNNLAKAEPGKTKALHQQLLSWRKSVNAPVPTGKNPKYER